MFSAHGVAPAVRAEAAPARLDVIDATCPLVAKVHTEARRFAADGDTVALIGHAGHDETEGTLGEAPGPIMLVRDRRRRRPAATPPTRRKVAYLTQTTLAVDEADGVVDALREPVPR